MWKAIAGILQLIILIFEWWGASKPQRQEANSEDKKQQDREDIVTGNTNAVSARLDRLLTKARDRAERGKDS